MYLKPDNKKNVWALDLESDGLKPTRIWCAVVKNLETSEELVFLDRESFLNWRQPEFVLIGHNIVSFDAPVLNALWGADIDLERSCIDTLVLSYLYNPKLDGGHSLESWGVRLDFLKSDWSDWTQYSEGMLKYCKNDVELTLRLYVALASKMYRMGFSELSCEIEHKIRIIIDEQEQNGIWFDVERAKSFCADLHKRQSDLSKSIQRLSPPRRQKVAEYSLRRRKDGSYFASYEKHRSKYTDIIIDEARGIYECYELIPFNLGSPQQRIQRLLELGWTPVSFTKKGNPQVDEDALLAFAEASPEGPQKEALVALAEWLVISGRLKMVAGNPETGSKGWLGNVQADSRIHGKVLSCGAASRRMLHFEPNTANIPSAAKAKYGKECRSFWGVEPNKGLIQVGVDASGLENVGLLHYLNNDKATEVLNQKKPNDVHSLNARELTKALGREIDREWGAKTSFYALIFGAYPPKLGSIVRGTKQDGEIVRDTLIKNVPGFERLIKEVQNEWKSNNGRLRTIDGGFVLCPSASAALNYRIQSLGAIVMKLASILLNKEAKKIGLWFRLIGTIHDEWQMETKEENGRQLGELAVNCITKAAEQLNFRIPLSGEYKLGYTWADCH